MANGERQFNQVLPEMNINIDKSVAEVLKSPENHSWGFILGRIFTSSIDVISMLNLTTTDIGECNESGRLHARNIEKLVIDISLSVPRGIDVVGIYCTDNNQVDKVGQFASDILFPKLIEELPELQDSADMFVIFTAQEESDDLEVDFLKAVVCSGEAEFPTLCVNYTAYVADEFFSHMYCMRFNTSIPWQFSAVDIDASISQEYSNINSKIKESQLAFTTKSSKSLFFLEDLGQTTVEKFLISSGISDTSDIVDFEMLLSMSSAKSDLTEVYSPILSFDTTADEVIKCTIGLDVVLYVEKLSLASELLHILRGSLCTQSKCILTSVTEFQKEYGICKLKVFHFKPFGMMHLVSTVYPVSRLDGSEILDEDLLQMRKNMHNLFMLPIEKPIFRKSQGYFNEFSSNHLINPHDGLKSGINDGICETVSGKYAYHHYMQDRFDDNGWGCAYRSLQTICSWFQLQGYTTANVPDHKQIQEALVKVGDKPINFLSSKQWIGSFEVSICLKEIFQVDSKILHVPSGAEMAFKGRELIEHFSSQGTPVMIGGGVLAHTILGIHFNESTGDIKFLILDPHYTGGEDLKTVQGKGWCGWKGPGFWDATAHYNMCLPQRPIVI